MITWDEHIQFTKATKKLFGRIKRKLRWHRFGVARYNCITFPTNRKISWIFTIWESCSSNGMRNRRTSFI